MPPLLLPVPAGDIIKVRTDEEARLKREETEDFFPPAFPSSLLLLLLLLAFLPLLPLPPLPLRDRKPFMPAFRKTLGMR